MNTNLKNAFIIVEECDYGVVTLVVFAQSEKEAKTLSFQYMALHYIQRSDSREVIMNIMAPYKGEDVVEVSYYIE